MLNNDQTAQVQPLSKEPEARSKKGIGSPVVLILVALICVGLITTAAAARFARQLELKEAQHTIVASVPEVQAVRVTEGTNKTTLLLPGDIQPIQNVPIYARANGYLVKRLVDIGDNVKAGQLLAVIDTPELDQQVQQAEANLSMAQASLSSAIADRDNFASQMFSADATISQAKNNLTYSQAEVARYQKLATEGAVSWEMRDQALKLYNSDLAQIEINEQNKKALLAQETSAESKIAAARQSIKSDNAALNRLRAEQSFQKVTAPCDGVITERLVDAGALVAAGGNSGTTQLLTMAKTDVLRIYVDVPQSDYRQIKDGNKAEILLQEFPGQTFTGTVSNMAGSLTADTRTLRTEVRIDNHEHTLKPGSYAQVQFVYNNPTPPVVVPSNATITKDDGLYVAVVQNGKVHYQKVTVYRDFGNKVELSTGVKAHEVVLLDTPDSISDGAAVKPILQQIASSK